MQTLVRAMKARGEEGQAIGLEAFPMLTAAGAKFRRGQLALVAAAPGGGKSALVTTFAVRAQVPTLYFSADTDTATLGTRIGASVTNYTINDVERGINGPDASGWFANIDAVTDHIWFCWDAGPTLTDIEEEVKAYAACNGQYPDLIVVDNLKNVWSDDGGGGEHVRYDRVLDFLHEMARETGSCIIILHHVIGAYEDGVTPIPLSGLLGKVGKTPRLIVTLYRPQDEVMGLCIVKNSSGRAAADASYKVGVAIDMATQFFGAEVQIW